MNAIQQKILIAFYMRYSLCWLRERYKQTHDLVEKMGIYTDNVRKIRNNIKCYRYVCTQRQGNGSGNLR